MEALKFRISQEKSGWDAISVPYEQRLRGPATYENIDVFLPDEAGITTNTKLWLVLYTDSDTIAGMPKPVELVLPPKAMNLELRTLQVGNEFQAWINEIQISEQVEITLHAADEKGLPSEEVIYRSDTLGPGIHRNLRFGQPIPARGSGDTVYWYRFFDAQGNEIGLPISATLTSPDAIVIRDLVIQPQQVGNGKNIWIDRILALENVTVELLADEMGVPAEAAMSWLYLPADNYPNILYPKVFFEIPKPNRPITDRSFGYVYWIHL